MAYQDYETTLEAQEKIIESGWTKRSKAPVVKRKSNRDGKEKRAADRGDGRFGSNVLLDANGDIVKPPISIALEEAMMKRDRLVGCFKPFFNDKEDQGRFFGIPNESVYSEIEGGGHLSVRTLDDAP